VWTVFKIDRHCQVTPLVALETEQRARDHADRMNVQFFPQFLYWAQRGPMIAFEGWEHVPGRGWIALVSSSDPTRDATNITLGACMEIDGNTYVIVGIEGAWNLTSPPKLSQRFGLVIRGEPVGNPSAARTQGPGASP